MVQPIVFSIDESAAKTEPAVLAEVNASANAGRSSAPAAIEDRVTLSQEALAALPSSNLLAFADSYRATLSREAAGVVPLSGQSEVEKLLSEGYSLSQIASEFDIPLPNVESGFEIRTFNTAA